MELTLEVQRQDEGSVLRCHGHVICGREAEALQTALERLFDVSEHVTLDLQDVRKMDCAGLGAIVVCLCAARQHGRSLELRSVPLRIRQMIRMTGLQAFLNLTEQPTSPSVDAFAA